MNLEISSATRIIILVTFVAYIVVTLLIGFFAGRKQKKDNYESGFFAGGRSLGGLALGMMMMATLLSSGTFVSAHGLTFRIGFSNAAAIFCAHLSLFLALMGTGKKIGIVGRRTDVISFVGLLRNRYSNSKVLVVAVALPTIVFLICYSASQIIGGARVFEAMTGGSYYLGLLLFGVIIGVYTIFGGMKSVAATSIFQGFIMVLSVVCLVFGYVSLVNNEFGSMNAMMTSLASSDSTSALLQPYGAWSKEMCISMIIMFAITSVALPHVAQGNLTYKNTKALKRACVIGGVSSFIVYVCVLLIGFVVKAVNPDLATADHATAYLAFVSLPAPLVGVMLSAVAAAIQSTVAAMLLLITAAITKDLVKDVFAPQMKESTMKWMTPSVLAAVCIVVLIFSFNPPDAVQLLVNYAIGGLASALFFPLLLGLYWPRTNEYGAIAGVLGGFVYFIAASSVIPAIAFGMNAFIASAIFSGILTIGVTLCTPKPPLGVVQVWFGKNYSKEYAMKK